MDELLTWLKSRKGNVVTFEAFQEKALGLIPTEQGKTALLRLLAVIVGQYTEASYGEPVSVADNASVLARLVRFVESAAALDASKPQQHLDLLNEIGGTDLGDFR